MIFHFQCSYFPSFWPLGLGPEYFRILLQSNCGVSVLDFTPKPDGGSTYICLNRLNQVYGLMHRNLIYKILHYFYLVACLSLHMGFVNDFRINSPGSEL